jgi:hypothetical protein
LNKSWYSHYQRVRLYLQNLAFAALKADGSIKVWGDPSSGGTGAPAGNDYTKIYSTDSAFAALKADGSIKVWGSPSSGGTGAPAGNDYTKIYSTASAFGRTCASRTWVTPRLD